MVDNRPESVKENNNIEKKSFSDRKMSADGKLPFKKSRFAFKRKKCRFCGKDKKIVDKEINYKSIEILNKFISDRGKILPSRLTGNCAIHQRKLKVEIKKARYIAFLPFARVEKINK